MKHNELPEKRNNIVEAKSQQDTPKVIDVNIDVLKAGAQWVKDNS